MWVMWWMTRSIPVQGVMTRQKKEMMSPRPSSAPVLPGPTLHSPALPSVLQPP